MVGPRQPDADILDDEVLEGEAEQGRLQGVLASLSSLASVFGPLLISQLYFAFRLRFPGIAWLAGAVVYLLCMPVLLRKAPRP